MSSLHVKHSIVLGKYISVNQEFIITLVIRL